MCFSRLLPFNWESRKQLSQLALPRVQLTVISTSKNSKMSSTDAVSSLLNGNLVRPLALIAAAITYISLLGEFVAKTVEEDLARLLAPPTIRTGTTEAPSVICRHHPQFMLLKPAQLS